jgi:hypothetical protein
MYLLDGARGTCFGREPRDSQILVVVLCCCLPAFPVRAATRDGEVDPAGFVTEYRRAVQVFRDAYRDIQVEGFVTSQVERRFSNPSSKNSRNVVVREFAYASTGGNQKMRVVTMERNGAAKDEQTKAVGGAAPKSSIEAVQVHAGDHTFVVRRTKSDVPYELVRSRLARSLDAEYEASRREIVDAPFCPANLSEFPDCVWSPEFKVQEVTRVTNVDGSLVKARFEYLPTDKQRHPMRGWIALDPVMNWAVRNYEIEIHYPNARPEAVKLVGWVRYKKQQAVVVPLEMSCTSTASNKQVTLESDRKLGILKFEFAVTPAVEFTPAAYGLRDSDLPSAK